ncbi:TetR/AcrR family transcriptional regulator [Streptomyces sp. HC44]|uniref:TetR/AcrR family transcriptional regulator n=1 Tax=Streptomyces scabichelini TaxID=2711217 RepID=A0A6G4VE13_9ACTN|nr:TetR/AcrR family transcriptional regulator [Streptomyces scabichelini]NGO12044.1 TetR/AcrR family transcriptional regulator [Streptomyces scabichelini]
MGRPRKFDETRVLTAVMNMFWQRGYEATSTRDLAESTGMGLSSLSNAFGDKRQLYLRALRRYYETNTALQTELLGQPGPVKDRLRNLMVQAIDIDLADPPSWGCLIINASTEMANTDPDVAQEVRRHFTTVEQAVHSALAEGQRSGEITREQDAVALTHHVLSSYYGLRVLARVRPDRTALMNVVDTMLATVTSHAPRVGQSGPGTGT